MADCRIMDVGMDPLNHQVVLRPATGDVLALAMDIEYMHILPKS
jgi:hypothetical protein